MLDLEYYNNLIQNVLTEMKKVIVGKDQVLNQVMYAILSRGHILFEDNPGLAKTLIAKSFASTLGCDFKRVQFTPDMLPSDITGSYIFDRKTSEFRLFKGPIFTNIILADEINRAPPKTQAALLESMQELQVTLEGETYKLDEPFITIATQNPIEYEGTYPLPEAQLDRFLVRLKIGYPSNQEEIEILTRRVLRKHDDVVVAQIIDKQVLLELQQRVEEIHIDSALEEYIVTIVQKTRTDTQVEVGASPRGSLALLKLARARALVEMRDFVIPDDIKNLASIALAHRLILRPEPWIRGVRAEDIIEKILKTTPVPKL